MGVKVLFHIFLLMLAGNVLASPDGAIREGIEETLFREELKETVEMLTAKKDRYKDERNYVEWVYYKVHRRHLKRYKQYSSMKETLSYGKYDCVTGTALYAAIYRSLGFEVAIKESTYHIYMLVSTENGNVLIESTDPINGVIINPDIMASWLSGNIPMNSSSSGPELFEPITNKDITMEMLAGLLHFNQAVRYFNEENFTCAMGYIEAAIDQYPSDRMFQMAAFIADGMRSSALVEPVISEIYCEKYLSESFSVVTNN